MVPHHYSQRLVIGLLFSVTLLIPLETVFACVMMKQVVERCCCDQKHRESTESEGAASDDRC